MKVRELAVPGAWEITPTVHGDSRGMFFEWLTDRGFSSFAGHHLDVRQANCSVSSAGVLRGVHYAQVPPSQAKYVTCVRGAVFDVVVDIRLGSPTFGQWDSVTLDSARCNAVYLAEGLGHAFLALEDDTVMTYLCSTSYNPAGEHGMIVVGFWGPVRKKDGSEGKLVYMLSFKDMADHDAKWKAFATDPEWQKVAKESEANGKLLEKIESVFLYDTDYAPGK